MVKNAAEKCERYNPFRTHRGKVISRKNTTPTACEDQKCPPFVPIAELGEVAGHGLPMCPGPHRPCAGRRYRFGGPSVGRSEPVGAAPIRSPRRSTDSGRPVPGSGGAARIGYGPGRCTIRTDPGAILEPMPPCLSAVALFRAAVASGVRISGGLR